MAKNNNKQDELNAEMLSKGRHRYWKRVNDAVDREIETSASHGRQLMSHILLPYVEGIKDWIKTAENRGKPGVSHSAHRFIVQVDPELLGFIASKGIMDGISIKKPYAAICNKIGNLVEDEVRFQFLKLNEPKLWRKLRAQVDQSSSYARKRTVIILSMNRTEKLAGGYHSGAASFHRWAQADKVKIGMVLIDIFQKVTGLVSTIYLHNTGGKKATNHLMAVPDALSWIANFHLWAEMMDPFWLPTVEPPIEWVTPYGGGYDPEDFQAFGLVKRDIHITDVTFDPEAMPEVYQAVNTLQRTGWKVEGRTLDVMKYFWDIGHEFAGLPPKDNLPLPPTPDNIKTDYDVRRDWRRKASRVYDLNVSISSQRIHVLKTFWLADRFRDEKKFYFPYQLDFRGRTYCVPYFLQPQGPDFSRALLKFSDAKPIRRKSEADWLAVYGANLWGYDKVTFEERVKWVQDNESDISKAAKDPINTSSWWSQADSPWQFLTWCFEWADFQREGFGFLTSLPVCLDASNNGLQILSLLMRDEVCGRATNCSGGPTPSDVYQDVADVVMTKLKEEATTGFTDDDGGKSMAQFWLDFGVNRKAVKRPVMVLPYGGTYYSCMGYIEEWFKDELRARSMDELFEQDDATKVRSLGTFLARRVWDAIHVVVGRPREAMRWLQEVAKITTKSGLPVKWTTPTGFPVSQNYKSWTHRTVKTALGDRIQKVKLREWSPTIMNRTRQVNGISPNFVHSLDAAALHKTICTAVFAGVHQFAMIHDSYGALAPDVDVLMASARRVFTDIFTVDLLARFKTEIEKQLPINTLLPDIPSYGTLDARSILESDFFFS